jgi:hypothetical protein
MKDKWQRFMARIMQWAGDQQGFTFVKMWFDGSDQPSSIHFAKSERAMNIAMRGHVETLDKNYEKE